MTAATYTRRLASMIDWRTGRHARRWAARRWGHPTVRELLDESGAILTTSTDTFVEHFGSVAHASDFAIAAAELEERTSARTFATTFDVGTTTSWLLYSHVRQFQPRAVLETGVANGVSSFFILRAMRENGHGTLHSIDTSREVGSLLTNEEKAPWDLRVLSPPTRRKFVSITADIGPLDLFLHDSDHRYPWMRLEFEFAWENVRPDGWIASDDVDATYAFGDLCRGHQLTPTILMDGTKFFGAVRRGRARGDELSVAAAP